MGGDIFGHQSPENIDPQLVKINIWLNLLKQGKRMFLGCNNYHKCSFNVFPLVKRGAGNPGRFDFDLSPGVGHFKRCRLGSPQRAGNYNLKFHGFKSELSVTFT